MQVNAVGNQAYSRFRGISPIVSAIILLAASIAAGIVVYQYFIKTVNIMAERPVVYFTAQYIPEIRKVYVTVNNGWTKEINVVGFDYTCSDGTSRTVTLRNPVKVRPGATTTIPLDIAAGCTPLVVIVKYKTSSGVSYTSEPVGVQ